MGANWTPRENNEQLAQIIQSRSRDKLDLLFVGKDWERKGGPLALDATLQLTHDPGYVVNGKKVWISTAHLSIRALAPCVTC